MVVQTPTTRHRFIPFRKSDIVPMCLQENQLSGHEASFKQLGHMLKQEAADERETQGLIRAANDRLNDTENSSLTYASRFDLAYSAALGFALAALRARGYRSDKRFLVFQCLEHTTDLSKVQIRLFAKCHDKRNLAEYEGHFETDEQLLSELIDNTKELQKLIEHV